MDTTKDSAGDRCPLDSGSCELYRMQKCWMLGASMPLLAGALAVCPKSDRLFQELQKASPLTVGLSATMERFAIRWLRQPDHPRYHDRERLERIDEVVKQAGYGVRVAWSRVNHRIIRLHYSNGLAIIVEPQLLRILDSVIECKDAKLAEVLQKQGSKLEKYLMKR